jgi:hypothetical protein
MTGMSAGTVVRMPQKRLKIPVLAAVRPARFEELTQAC